MKKFEKRVAVVTGGGKGIGKSIALALAEQGCRVCVAGRTESDLEQAGQELKEIAGDALAIPTDIRDFKSVRNLAREVEEKFGPPHFLINNAGIGNFSHVIDMDPASFQAVIETNLYGVFYCCKAFLPGMIQNNGGHIVNISSLASKNNFAGGSAYCASKHGLNSFAECLMLEIRHQNIKITTICPGSVQTGFSPESLEKNWALTGEDVAEAVVDVLSTSPASLISLVDMRPLRPPKR